MKAKNAMVERRRAKNAMEERRRAKNAMEEWRRAPGWTKAKNVFARI